MGERSANGGPAAGAPLAALITPRAGTGLDLVARFGAPAPSATLGALVGLGVASSVIYQRFRDL